MSAPLGFIEPFNVALVESTELGANVVASGSVPPEVNFLIAPYSVPNSWSPRI